MSRIRFSLIAGFIPVLALVWLSGFHSGSIPRRTAAADLSITKTANASETGYGQLLVFTLTVENDGPDAAQEVAIIDNLPAALEFSFATGSCTYDSQEHRVLCDVGELSSGSSASVLIYAGVLTTTSSEITNTASVSSATPDENPDNDSSTVSVAMAPHVDMAVEMTAEPDSVLPGDVITYSISVSNNGNIPATGVSVTDELPEDVVVQSMTPSGGTCSVSTTRCELGSMEPGESIEIELAVVYEPPDPVGTAGKLSNPSTLQNKASAESNEDDPRPTNSSTSWATPVIPWGNLVTAVSASTHDLIFHEPVEISITIRYGSLFDLDAKGVYLAAELTGSWYYDVTSSHPECEIDTSFLLECRFGSLPEGTVVDITLTVEVEEFPTEGRETTIEFFAFTTTPEKDKTDNNASILLVEQPGSFIRDQVASDLIDQISQSCPASTAGAALLTQEPLPAGTEVSAFKPSEFNVTLDRDSWLAYINCHPQARYPHDGAAVIVAADDPEAEPDIFPVKWALKVNGEPAFAQEDRIHGSDAPVETVPDAAAVTDQSEPARRPRVCALLVSGSGQDAAEQLAFNGDLTLVEKNLTLEKLGPRIAEENILINTNVDEATLFEQIESMKGRCDVIYIYYSGHSDKNGPMLRDSETTWKAIAEKLAATNAGEINVMLDSCESGGAIPHFESTTAEVNQVVTVVTAASSDKSSYTHDILQADQTGGNPVRHGYFTWLIAVAFGNPAADADGDGSTSVAEAFRWMKEQNPTLDGSPVSELMDPQITRSQTEVITSNLVVAPAGSDVQINLSQPLPGGTRIRINQREGLDDTRTDDIDVKEISTGRYWSISSSGGDLLGAAEIAFGLNPAFEHFTIEGTPGIVTREGTDLSWEPIAVTAYDPLANTVTAYDIDHFSEWAVAIVEGASTVGVDDEIPAEFALHQNYPNPFSYSTTFSFDVPEPRHVRLEVFDGLARRVATVVDGVLSPAKHRVAFRGDGLPAGVYVYVLEVGRFRDDGMMVIVR